MTNEKISIASHALTADVSLSGAELVKLASSDGQDLLWSGNPAIWKGQAPVLFPVIGMLNGGGYNYNGHRYEMPKHGFARMSLFKVRDATASSVTLHLAASQATRKTYPFEFILTLMFVMTDSTLCITAKIENRGDRDMPFSFGFHPAFRWPLPFGGERASHRIVFERKETAPIRRIDADGLLTEEPHPTPVESRTLRLEDSLFEDDALVFDRLHSRSLLYGAPGMQNLAITWRDLPDFAVWTKPGADFICCEPWQGFADPVGFDGDIRDKPGIVILAPDTSRSFSVAIALREPQSC